MLVSLTDNRGKIHDYHNGNPDLLCICEPGDDIVKTVNSALLGVAAIVHTTTAHMGTEGTLTLGEIWQAQASDCEYQSAAQTVNFPPLYLRMTETVS